MLSKSIVVSCTKCQLNDKIAVVLFSNNGGLSFRLPRNNFEDLYFSSFENVSLHKQSHAKN